VHEAWASKLLGVDSPEKLKDLRVGPWEGDTPGSSSLEGEPIPLRDALFAQGESGNLDYITPNTDRIKNKGVGEDWTEALSWAKSPELGRVALRKPRQMAQLAVSSILFKSPWR
jgi:hypothetical protein